MTLELYCICGDGMEGSLDPKGEPAYRAAWEEVHTGEGHRPCTRDEAVAVHVAKHGFEPWKREEAGDL